MYKQLDVLSRLRRILSFSSKMCLYKSFVMSYLTYCSSIWHHCLKTVSNKLEKLHGRVLRYICRDRSSDYRALTDRTGYTLAGRRLQDMLIIIYKALNNRLPVYHTSYEL